MHLNSVISTEGAKHMTMDLKDFSLKFYLLECEHVKIKLSTTPSDFAAQCDSHNLVDKSGHVYAEVRGRMCGFPQVGRLAYEDLKSHFSQCSYNAVKFTPG